MVRAFCAEWGVLPASDRYCSLFIMRRVLSVLFHQQCEINAGLGGPVWGFEQR